MKTKYNKIIGKKGKKIKREILLIVGFFVFLIVLYFVAGAFFRSLNNFEYEGLKFTKEKYGDKPIYRHYYYYKDSTGKIIQYNLYLINDPRKNKFVVSGDPILFTKRTIYIAIDDSYPRCNDNLAAVVDLSSFLSGNDFKVISGFTNKTIATETDSPHISCERKPWYEVIELLGGNETKIVIDGDCHRIYIGPECLAQKAIEKFKVRAVLDARLENNKTNN